MKHLGIRVDDKLKDDLEQMLEPYGTSIQFWLEKLIKKGMAEKFIPWEKPCVKSKSQMEKS